MELLSKSKHFIIPKRMKLMWLDKLGLQFSCYKSLKWIKIHVSDVSLNLIGVVSSKLQCTQLASQLKIAQEKLFSSAWMYGCMDVPEEYLGVPSEYLSDQYQQVTIRLWPCTVSMEQTLSKSSFCQIKVLIKHILHVNMFQMFSIIAWVGTCQNFRKAGITQTKCKSIFLQSFLSQKATSWSASQYLYSVSGKMTITGGNG